MNLFGRERGRRARGRSALRHEPKLEGVRLAVAAVDEAYTVAAQAARGRQVLDCALAHALGLARTAVAARVCEDVADRARIVLKLNRQVIEPRLVVVVRHGRELVEALGRRQLRERGDAGRSLCSLSARAVARAVVNNEYRSDPTVV